MKSVFVIMPFKDFFNEYYNHVYKPALEGCGYTVERADDIFSPTPILEDIRNSIKKSDVIFCDMTEKNANVFYELGLAHSIGKPVILITQSLDDVPFDLRQIRCLTYNPLTTMWKSKFKNDVKKALKEVEKGIFYNGTMYGNEMQIVFNELGIKQIYPKAARIDSLERAILSAKEFRSIAYVGDTFAEYHRDEYKQLFKNGTSFFILVGREYSDFLNEVEAMENMKKGTVSDKIKNVKSEYARLKEENPTGKGTVEIRQFNTEFRNSITMCKDENGNTTAWLTVMFSNRRAADSFMLEFDSERGLEYCESYFKKMWDLHSDDVLYKSSGKSFDLPIKDIAIDDSFTTV